MFRFIKNLLGAETKPTKAGRRNNPYRRSLRGVEGLEGRDLMAAMISVSNGDLYIQGTAAAEDIQVSKLSGYNAYQITEKSLVNGRAITTSTTKYVSGGDVFFYGLGGNDKFTADHTTLRVTAHGGDGDDQLIGSYVDGFMYGGNGNDTLRGGGALYGDAGNDTITGSNRNDRIDGGVGADLLDGGSGDDTILAGADLSGNRINGGYGNDTITGGYGIDYLYGDDGNDTLDGGYGGDYLSGGNGIDTLYAGNDSEHNTLHGDAGNDKLYGSNGNDWLFGDAGIDWLHGNAGDDYLNGGSGRDYMFGDAGNDTLNGGGDDDEYDLMYGGVGADLFYNEDDHGGGGFPYVSYDPEPARSECYYDFQEGIDTVIYI